MKRSREGGREERREVPSAVAQSMPSPVSIILRRAWTKDLFRRGWIVGGVEKEEEEEGEEEEGGRCGVSGKAATEARPT